jgi:hypothetical protein
LRRAPALVACTFATVVLAGPGWALAERGPVVRAAAAPRVVLAVSSPRAAAAAPRVGLAVSSPRAAAAAPQVGPAVSSPRAAAAAPRVGASAPRVVPGDAALGAPADVVLRPGATPPRAGTIPPRFAGFSVEWSLVERYMGAAARPAFANLLRNLGSGELRMGGSSQDLMPFEPAAANTNRNITPEDLRAVRATLDAANAADRRREDPSWGTILGTALAPVEPERPWVSPEHARAFAQQGVVPAFAGGGERYVAGIGLGNEPDITYDFDLPRYLGDLAAYRVAAVTRPYPIVAPSTSETIAPWQAIEARSVQTRFFHDWPQILDTIAPAMKAVTTVHGTLATDHFYPLARGCTTDEYRCASIERLLSDERLANLAYEVYTHAVMARQRGLDYRLQETGTAAGRGGDGVSNVAAAATWTLAAALESACPQPPNAPGANADCATGAIGINLHNAEVNRFFFPEEGNAFYNAIAYDPSPAAGAPVAAPPYYGLLLFARFAQGTRGLRPVAPAPGTDPTARIRAWEAGAGFLGRRLLLVNLAARPLVAAVAAPGHRYEIDRMTPFDPTGAGRTLDASQVRVDGRAVAADGTWPGCDPRVGRTRSDQLHVALAPGEAAVVTLP